MRDYQADVGLGAQLGKDFESKFAERAKAVGLTDEEAKSAFNKNMMSTGLLSESPAEFGRSHKRRWLVTDYSAGDVVLHNPYAVRCLLKYSLCFKLLTGNVISGRSTLPPSIMILIMSSVSRRT
jgi:hypothetical protein